MVRLDITVLFFLLLWAGKYAVWVLGKIRLAIFWHCWHSSLLSVLKGAVTSCLCSLYLIQNMRVGPWIAFPYFQTRASELTGKALLGIQIMLLCTVWLSRDKFGELQIISHSFIEIPCAATLSNFIGCILTLTTFYYYDKSDEMKVMLYNTLLMITCKDVSLRELRDVTRYLWHDFQRVICPSVVH